MRHSSNLHQSLDSPLILPLLCDMAVCAAARQRHCWEWARVHMDYCICGLRDGASFGLGLISVASWGVAEIPQIITNFKDKSTEGLSLGFLFTWIIGDLLNLLGCKFEPATLPTQYYMAMLYTLTTMVLTGQAIYYSHVYPRLKCRRGHYKGALLSQDETVEKYRQRKNEVVSIGVNGSDRRIGSNSFGSGNVPSAPIPFRVRPARGSPERETYYMSARSLSRSHTPTERSYLAQHNNPTSPQAENSIEQPLLGEQASSSPKNKKSILCLVSAVMFIGTLNIRHSAKDSVDKLLESTTPGFVFRAGRNLSQVGDTFLQENVRRGVGGVGTFLGWGMAAIYMGGRLPQICLNIRRGNVEGLNPLMFMFALIGNGTYVASILVNSTDWSKIRPNLPWLVDAGGCMLLDAFILIQFIYFRLWSSQDMVDKQSNSGLASMETITVSSGEVFQS